MKDEKLTYQILEERFKEQDRLIAEGKIQRPKRIIRDFTPEEQKRFDSAKTVDEVFNNLDRKFGIT